jgi:5S rRNA maturation endonuclease (ribonuclease M5)
MRKPKSYVWFIAVAVVLVATLSVLGSAAAQKASVPKPQDKLALGEDDVKHLLLLMDADHKGMVSKQEFMKYMEAEFERLDKNKIGQLNVKELTRSNLTASYLLGK